MVSEEPEKLNHIREIESNIPKIREALIQKNFLSFNGALIEIRRHNDDFFLLIGHPKERAISLDHKGNWIYFFDKTDLCHMLFESKEEIISLLCKKEKKEEEW